jgi:hypothetical protein
VDSVDSQTRSLIHILAEHSDQDPFLIFAWRGGNQEESMACGLWISPLASETPDLLLRALGPARVECDGMNVAEVRTPCYATLA